jgi:DNA-binding FadR family transcriptional regulator
MPLPRDVPSELETVVLAYIASHDEPVGSQRLKEALAEAGFSVAEATVGRYLRSLDQRGYTQSVKKTRGRVITERGEERLVELARERRRASLSAVLIEAVSADSVTALLELLAVRRVIEPEGVRLATLRASAEEIEAIAQLAQRHVQGVGNVDVSIEVGRNLHSAVAEASQNGVLAAVAAFLLDPAHDELQLLLNQIMFESGEALDFAQDHQRIIRQMRSRDPVKAELAMRDHIEKLIAVVERYQSSFQEGAKPAAASEMRRKTA